MRDSQLLGMHTFRALRLSLHLRLKQYQIYEVRIYIQTKLSVLILK